MEESTVYVTKQGTQVGISGGRLEVRDQKQDGEVLASFPVTKVEALNIFGGVDLTTHVYATAHNESFVISVFTRNGTFRGQFVPAKNTQAKVHRAQCSITSQEQLGIARAIVTARIHNAATLLSRREITPPPKLREYRDAANTAAGMDELRGIEGAAISCYFNHFDSLLNDEWTFETRTRKPPEDEINALLSLTYSMLTSRVKSAIYSVNLNPFIGIYHSNREGRPSLALDLVEPFRAVFADAFVTTLVNRQVMTHDDFRKNHYLSENAFRRYLTHLDEFLDQRLRHPVTDRKRTKLDCLRLEARHLRQALLERVNTYRPFVLHT